MSEILTFEQHAEWLARKLAGWEGDEPAAAGVLPSCLCCGKARGPAKVWLIDHPEAFVCESCHTAANDVPSDCGALATLADDLQGVAGEIAGWAVWAHQSADVVPAAMPTELDDAMSNLMQIAEKVREAGAPPTNCGGWIPVSERLPNPRGGSVEYIVASSTGYVTSLEFDADGWRGLDKREDDPGYWNKFVTHWQPMPQPPHARGGSGVRCYHYKPCSEGKHVEGLEFVRCAECPARPGIKLVPCKDIADMTPEEAQQMFGQKPQPGGPSE